MPACKFKGDLDLKAKDNSEKAFPVVGNCTNLPETSEYNKGKTKFDYCAVYSQKECKGEKEVINFKSKYLSLDFVAKSYKCACTLSELKVA